MAGYKAHFATGILLGGFTVAGALVVFAVEIILAPYIFVSVIIGSFLPDVDSDTGIPVKLLLFIFGITLAAFVGYYLYDAVELTVYATLVGALVTFGFVNYALKFLFNRLTTHRGIMHSLVAVIIAFLGFNFLLLIIGLKIFDSMLLSGALGIGYIGHLIVDETNSIVNLSGIPFIPKKSLGTA